MSESSELKAMDETTMAGRLFRRYKSVNGTGTRTMSPCRRRISVLIVQRITSMHLVCGIFGTLCVGLFTTSDLSTTVANTPMGAAAVGGPYAGLFFGGGTKQLIGQLVGVLLVGAYVAPVSAICWLILKAVVGLRVSPQEERRAPQRGLPRLRHGSHGVTVQKDAPTAWASTPPRSPKPGHFSVHRGPRRGLRMPDRVGDEDQPTRNTTPNEPPRVSRASHRFRASGALVAGTAFRGRLAKLRNSGKAVRTKASLGLANGRKVVKPRTLG
jgi:hypothetical protein